MNLVEEEFLYTDFVFFCCIFAKLLLTLACVPQAFIVVIDIHQNLILKIDDLVLILAFLDFLYPLPLQFCPFVRLEVIDGLCYALHHQ